LQEKTVTIEKMAFGGSGVGHVDGKVCFVPVTAIGDTVRIRTKTEKKSYIEAMVHKMVRPSPFRAEPQCPIFGICGGCDWQHLEYGAQLKAKEEIFAEILWRTARVERNLIMPIVGSQEPYGYRSRVQLKMRRADGKNHIGFFMAGSHYVVDIPGSCAISCESVNVTYRELCKVLSDFPEPEKLPQIDVSVGDDENTILVIHYIGERRAAVIDFLESNRQALSRVKGVFLQSGRKKNIKKVYGTDSISYTIPRSVLKDLAEMRLYTSRGGFSQVNYSQNHVLIGTLLDWAQLAGKERILDLYCGNGNFSLPLALCSGEVTGFEEYDQSIADADFNRDQNGLSNVSFQSVDSVTGLKKLVDAGESFDMVILDPPRSGAAEAVKLIPALQPEKIIYISCDPPTLARDIASLKKSNYRVVKSRPVDLFPQTYHIESVTMMEKSIDAT
jgi:23S rRNA (uracil1939-C5)-methyltransferase